MAGAYDLQEVQLGQEVVAWGTPAVGTVRLMGITECVFQPEKPAKVIKQLHGSLGVGNIGARMMGRGSGSIKGIVLYEDVPYWLENVYGIVTPSGAGPYVRAGAPPLIASAINPRYMTLIKGDTADGVYKMDGMLVDTLAFNVVQSEGDNEMTFDAKLMSKDVSTGALAVLADRATSIVSANDVAIWIDVPGTAPGTTAVASTAWGAAWNLAAARKFKAYLGQSTPGGIVQESYDAKANSVKLSFELNATSKAFLDAIIGTATFQKNVRIKATQGANIFQVDIGVQAKTAPAVVTANNGTKSLVIDCEMIETTGVGNFFRWQVTNSVAALA